MELQDYTKDGVSLWLDDEECTPVRAARKCLLKDDGCYMRDYVFDEENHIVQIRFDRISAGQNDCSKGSGNRS